MTEMTIDDFIKQEISRLKRYRKWYRRAMYEDPEHVLDWLPSESWPIDYQIFCQQHDKPEGNE